MTDDKNEGLYGNPENLKAQNIRVIIITAITALVVLGITAWGIIYAVGGNKADETSTVDDTETVEISTDDTTSAEKKDKTIKEDAAKEEKQQTEQKDKTSDKKEQEVLEVTNLKEDTDGAPAIAPANENDIPRTGPEDILPLALVLGMFAAFISSAKLAKSEA